MKYFGSIVIYVKGVIVVCWVFDWYNQEGLMMEIGIFFMLVYLLECIFYDVIWWDLDVIELVD